MAQFACQASPSAQPLPGSGVNLEDSGHGPEPQALTPHQSTSASLLAHPLLLPELQPFRLLAAPQLPASPSFWDGLPHLRQLGCKLVPLAPVFGTLLGT